MELKRFVVLLSLFFPAWTHSPCLAKEPPKSQIVDLTATDGAKLKATYFSAGKPGPGVLLLHQCDHERKIWDGLAQQLAGAGINVLTFDFRGFGESGGVPHDKVHPMGPPDQVQMWPADIDLALGYLKSQAGVKADAIGIGGASCGVDYSIKTAMNHPEVKSLVLLAGPVTVKERSFLRQTTLPVFFAVADDDQYPPIPQLTQWFYFLTASPGKKLAQYQTGHHGAEIFAVHPDLPVAIVDWYVTTLIKTPGRAAASAGAPAIPAEIQALELLDQPGGPASLAQTLLKARQEDPKTPVPPERVMISVAFGYLQDGDAKQAVEILKTGTTAYPNSPLQYAALGQVGLASGQKDLARQSAEKALELLPSDTVHPQDIRDAIKASAQRQLKQLSGAQ